MIELKLWEDQNGNVVENYEDRYMTDENGIRWVMNKYANEIIERERLSNDKLKAEMKKLIGSLENKIESIDIECAEMSIPKDFDGIYEGLKQINQLIDQM